jgi:hypothetical protein
VSLAQFVAQVAQTTSAEAQSPARPFLLGLAGIQYLPPIACRIDLPYLRWSAHPEINQVREFEELVLSQRIRFRRRHAVRKTFLGFLQFVWRFRKSRKGLQNS